MTRFLNLVANVVIVLTAVTLVGMAAGAACLAWTLLYLIGKSL